MLGTVLEHLPQKDLLAFAHTKEAQYFLNTEDIYLKKINLINPQYYQSKEFDLFITGGGPEKVSLNLTNLLTALRYFDEGIYFPKSIINLGVAATPVSNYPQFSIGSVHQVRTVYGYLGSEPQFKSFSTENIFPESKNETDCVSLSRRAVHTDTPELSRLFPNAQLIDQELWTICYIAKQFGLSVSSLKVISDELDNTSHSNPASNQTEPELTKEIQKNNELFKILASTFQKTFKTNNRKKTTDSYPWENQVDFYFTTRQRQIVNELLKKLEIKFKDDTNPTAKVLESIDWNQFKMNLSEKLYTPKQRTEKLITWLDQHIEHYSQKFKSEFQVLLKQLPKSVRVQFDPLLENPFLHFSFQSETIHQFKENLESLNDIPTELLEQIFNLYAGDIEV